VYLRELFFYNAVTCALVCVDKFADLRFVSALKIYVPAVLIPLSKGDFVGWIYILKDFFERLIASNDPASILYNKHKVITHLEPHDFTIQVHSKIRPYMH
jgi:hypothetical protein